jgi:hypothetical protein
MYLPIYFLHRIHTERLSEDSKNKVVMYSKSTLHNGEIPSFNKKKQEMALGSHQDWTNMEKRL